MQQDTDGERLFRRFESGGFDALLESQVTELIDYLEQRATATGLVAPLFIAEAIRAVQNLHKEHDESGGVRSRFLDKVNDLVRNDLPKLHTLSADPIQAARFAQNFRNQVLSDVAGYDSAETYE